MNLKNKTKDKFNIKILDNIRGILKNKNRKPKKTLTAKQRRKKRAVRNRVIVLSALVVFVTFIILIFNLIFGNKHVKALSSEQLIKYEIAKGKDLKVVKNGAIVKEENEVFNKISIPINNKENFVSSKSVNNVLVLTFKNNTNLNFNLEKSMFKNSKDFSQVVQGDTLELRIKGGNVNYVFEDPDDSTKLQVLTSKVDNPFKSKVVLDPGHGGNDEGTAYQPDKLLEKDLNLTVASKVTPRLIYQGVEVVQTRYVDEIVYLNDIVKKTTKENPTTFVSLHINANEDPKVSGIEVYYYNKTDDLEDKDVALAKSIIKEITKSDGWEANGTGVKKEDYIVIKSNEMPSVLVEMGFITNQTDRNKLKDDNVLKNLSINISNGIKNFLSGQ